MLLVPVSNSSWEAKVEVVLLSLALPSCNPVPKPQSHREAGIAQTIVFRQINRLCLMQHNSNWTCSPFSCILCTFARNDKWFKQQLVISLHCERHNLVAAHCVIKSKKTKQKIFKYIYPLNSTMHPYILQFDRCVLVIFPVCGATLRLLFESSKNRYDRKRRGASN